MTLEHVETSLPEYPLEDYARNYPFRYADEDYPNIVSGLERRYAIESVWRDIASGTASRHTREEWLDHIAGKVLTELIDNPALSEKHKGSAALSVLGLLGRKVINSKLLDDIDTLMAFGDLDQPSRRITHLEIVKSLRSSGHFARLSEGQAVRLLRNLLANRPAE